LIEGWRMVPVPMVGNILPSAADIVVLGDMIE
jgi:hypothetical protein